MSTYSWTFSPILQAQKIVILVLQVIRLVTNYTMYTTLKCNFIAWSTINFHNLFLCLNIFLSKKKTNPEILLPFLLVPDCFFHVV